ncbi:MAG: hypothetical protein E5Y14_11010 [Mesorhizobium sp.]|nr:MAG: hypothetical protein E5Y14_11010 [Mesorhizobium sp.]
MAWAVFHKESNWSRPNCRFSFNAHASDLPQQRPRDFVDYCVGRGWAEHYPPPNKETAAKIRKRQAKN